MGQLNIYHHIVIYNIAQENVCRVHILTEKGGGGGGGEKKDVNAQYMILGFCSHSLLLEHLGLARKQW